LFSKNISGLGTAIWHERRLETFFLTAEAFEIGSRKLISCLPEIMPFIPAKATSAEPVTGVMMLNIASPSRMGEATTNVQRRKRYQFGRNFLESPIFLITGQEI